MMDVTTVLLIAAGLSMDALAVSIAWGVSLKKDRFKTALLMALFFGGFQALMPVIGWAAGISFVHLISGFDHWIAFLILCFVGAKMCYESIKSEKCERNTSMPSLSVLLLLAVATSIDALAVGLSFAFLNTDIMVPSLIIGGVTFCVTSMGVLLGKRLGCIFGSRIELLGGIILIGIGVKILFEHMT
jgi:putative Mn2+ efflux pump MntP